MVLKLDKIVMVKYVNYFINNTKNIIQVEENKVYNQTVNGTLLISIKTSIKQQNNYLLKLII